MRYVFNSFIIILFLIACTPHKTVTYTPTANSDKIPESVDGAFAQNIILLIGDGMGISQITAGMYSNGNKLALEQFNKIGFHKNYAYNDLITDSAAGATAFSCGVKTYNGAIGVGPDTLPRYTILEEAEDRGYLTGMVTSSTIVHATPASFIAHNRQRRNYEEIAVDFLKTDIDLFIGGGNKYFSRRLDERNLTAEMESKGYYMSNYFDEELNDVDFKKHKKIGYLTSDGDPLSVDQGRDYLPIATQKAIDFMEYNCEENQGYFLMIEGAQIDWGGHANKGNYIVSEMIDFDKVIDAVLNYTKKHPETLVIVTADHETGGLAINKGSTMNKLDMKFTSDYHTGDLIPVFASGPQSDLFTGFYENSDIYQLMRTAFGWQRGSKM
jgi:alkaline phosphatase